MLIDGLFSTLTGGMATFLSTMNYFIIMNTSLEYRNFRFTIFQVYLFIGNQSINQSNQFSDALLSFVTLYLGLSIGQLIGGYLLQLNTNPDELQLRNYNLSNWISLSLYTISLLTILISLIVYKSGKKSSQTSDENANVENSQQTIDSFDKPTKQNAETLMEFMLGRLRNFRGILFNTNNIRETYQCLFKKRAGYGRLHIILILTLLFLNFINYFGLSTVFLQFCQKTYQLNPKTYSLVNAMSIIIPKTIMMCASYLLLTKWKLSNSTSLMLTLSSGFLNQVLIGSIPNIQAYFVAIFIGSIYGLVIVLCKTILSDIIPNDEAGKMFSIVSSIESLGPSMGTFIFSTLFSVTLSTYPTMIYHFAASLTLIGIILAIIQGLFFQC